MLVGLKKYFIDNTLLLKLYAEYNIFEHSQTSMKLK